MDFIHVIDSEPRIYKFRSLSDRGNKHQYIPKFALINYINTLIDIISTIRAKFIAIIISDATDIIFSAIFGGPISKSVKFIMQPICVFDNCTGIKLPWTDYTVIELSYNRSLGYGLRRIFESAHFCDVYRIVDARQLCRNLVISGSSGIYHCNTDTIHVGTK